MKRFYILRNIESGEKYIFDDDGIRKYKDEALGRMDVTLLSLKTAEKELMKIRDSLIDDERKLLNSLTKDSVEDIFISAETIGGTSNHEIVKDLAKEVRELINTLNERFRAFNIFSREKKLLLIRNLRETVESIGYNFEIEEVIEESKIKVAIYNEKERRVYMFTTEHFDIINSDPQLHELLSPMSIIPFMSKERKKMLLEKLERFRIE